ncbi:MAG: rod shape-determining protein MreC [Cyclobacteriaceae bacterium]|jgi:rod shape-determining protein MreC|nr:rod shape-determining protein MreC [Cytophagales bacterium]HNP77083.1 rod shape-determining protein MreC [Cyclobacteriaceae bacterium]HQQ82064.1 rod shape-determining protein MreC [Cyclobacteriaceae bacterium]
MQRLFNFLFVYRAFFTFLLLELLCAWLLVENNQYQSTQFFNSSNRFAAGILAFSQSSREYFSLRQINEEIARENAQLRTALELSLQEKGSHGLDTLRRYDFVSARVVNNSVAQFKNYITVDRGRQDGLEPGMAAISTFGAVGKVKSVSDHYAVLTSVLNIDEQISCVLSRTGNFGTVQWDGTDPRMVNMRYVPRHVTPQPGDTILTSGYNAVFPPGIMVGLVKEVSLKDEALFYEIRVELAQDFRQLSFVKLVKSRFRKEQDSLETKTIGIPK